MTNKREFQKEELPFELQSGHLGHLVQCATVQKVDDALKRVARNKAFKCGETKPSPSSSSSSRSSFSSPLLQNLLRASILTLPFPLVARYLKHLDASFHEYHQKNVNSSKSLHGEHIYDMTMLKAYPFSFYVGRKTG
jgi:hypothetical protein